MSEIAMKYKERDKLIAKAKKLREEGMSWQKIADKLGVGKGDTVQCWLVPATCKKTNERSTNYYEKHREELGEKNRAYHAAHRDECNTRSKEYYENHKPEHRANVKKWSEANSERVHEMAVRYRKIHREEINERNRRWSAANREACTERTYRWREANKEHYREYEKQYRGTHREETRAAARRYAANHPERVREYRNKHKDEYLAHARLRKAKIKEYDKISQEEYDAMFKKQKGLCAYCNKPMRVSGSQHHPRYRTMDHIFPLSRGGVHTLENIVFICRGCNSSKHDKTIREWRPKLLSKIGNGVQGKK